jgi:predicted flap endonuclease-1-like 5' DNA nuclease
MEKELQQLDKMVSEGKILEAFDKFFHNDVVTWSDKKDKTTSKDEKKNFLIDFFKKMKSLDESKLHDSFIDGNTSYSKYTFLFTNQEGEKLKWHEIIRRKWNDRLVVDEFYFQDSFSDLKNRIEKKKRKAKDKAVDKKTTKKVKAPKTEKKAFEMLTADQTPIDNSNLKSIKSEVQAKASTLTSKTKKATISEKKVFEQLTADQTPIENPNLKAIKSEVQVKASTQTTKTKKAPISEKKAFKQLIAVQTPIDNSNLKAIKPEVQVKASTQTTKTKKAPISIDTMSKPKALEEKKPITKVKKERDITLIEGIGPKIKELLAMDGIKTFDHVAKSKVEDLKNIMLTRGGTRYNANNPSTWPEQAALAALGKWEELKKLKAELKFGKRVE